MKQVFMSGAGQVEVFDVPLSGQLPQSVLVRNAFSIISSGTEGAAVTRRSGLLGIYEKARSSKDRVEQAWQLAKNLGYGKALEIIRNKLKDHSPMGYSCAGEIIEISEPDMPFNIGDRVACMGAGFANHAEYAVVPATLIARLPNGVPLDQASFAALACIALQGIRRLELTPGEWVGVIGLGLIGQICIRLLVAMGYRAVGIDLDPARVAKAAEVPGVHAWASGDTDSENQVQQLTGGQGLDGVVLCAATQSDGPVNLAFDLCRHHGRVSVVGSVGLGLDRAKMYKKELELRLSCSYGPGRYDPEYEMQGRDYPLSYVRWTEGRNLSYFLELLAEGSLDLSPLITTTFPIEQAREAFLRVKESDPNTYGVLFEYAAPEEGATPDVAEARTLRIEARKEHGEGAEGGPDSASLRAAPPVGEEKGRREGVIRLGLIGVGGFSKGVHVPNLKKLSDLYQIAGIADLAGGAAGVMAKRTGAPLATSDHQVLLDEPNIDAVLIATRHSSHAKIALDALDAGKHVFIEKPLATTVADAQEIVAKAAETGLTVRVGFNRRFSPYMNAMRQAIGGGGRVMLSVRVNVGAIGEHWSNTPEEGGRFLGEAVHFFDVCNWFVGEEPLALAATFMGEAEVTNPDGAVILKYPGGSTAQVLYTSQGHTAMGKEYYEAYGNGRSVRSDDFETVKAYGASGSVGRRDRGNKGLREELEEFAAAIRGEDYPVQGADARAGLIATWAALASYESAKSGRWIAREG